MPTFYLIVVGITYSCAFGLFAWTLSWGYSPFGVTPSFFMASPQCSFWAYFFLGVFRLSFLFPFSRGFSSEGLFGGKSFLRGVFVFTGAFEGGGFSYYAPTSPLFWGGPLLFVRAGFPRWGTFGGGQIPGEYVSGGPFYLSGHGRP